MGKEQYEERTKDCSNWITTPRPIKDKSSCFQVFTKSETRPRVYRFLLVPRVTGLGVGVFDTLSDSIQHLNFAQKMINSIFNLILLYSRFNSKYC